MDRNENHTPTTTLSYLQKSLSKLSCHDNFLSFINFFHSTKSVFRTKISSELNLGLIHVTFFLTREAVQCYHFGPVLTENIMIKITVYFHLVISSEWNTWNVIIWSRWKRQTGIGLNEFQSILKILLFLFIKCTFFQMIVHCGAAGKALYITWGPRAAFVIF